MKHRVAICSVLLIGAFVGCSGKGGRALDSQHHGVVTRGPAPSYIDAVAAYNAARPKIDRLRAPAVVRLTYADENGKVHNEQGDGLLQLIAPARVALSLRKVGTPILWLGCDAERSWFFDLISDEQSAIVRSNTAVDRPNDGSSSFVGMAFRPSDLMVMLGLTDLDIHADGGTQWSADGARLGITTRLGEEGGGGGRGEPAILRLWLDPAKQRPVKAEWFDAEQRPVLIAEMSGDEPVEHTGAGGRPMIPARIAASHPATGTYIRLDLSSAQGGELARIADDAFRFEALCEYLGVKKVVDADEPVPRRQ